MALMTSLLALYSNTSAFLGPTETEITYETIYCKAMDSYQMCICIIPVMRCFPYNCQHFYIDIFPYILS